MKEETDVLLLDHLTTLNLGWWGSSGWPRILTTDAVSRLGLCNGYDESAKWK